MSDIFVVFKDDKDKKFIVLAVAFMIFQHNYMKMIFLLKNRVKLVNLLKIFKDFVEKHQTSICDDERMIRVQMKCITVVTVINVISLLLLATVFTYIFSFFADQDQKPFIMMIEIPGTE